MARALALLILAAAPSAGGGRAYFADPSAGADENDGLTAATAWRSLDRGQPTQVRAAAAPGASSLAVARAVQLPPSGVVRLVFGPHTPPGIRLQYGHRDGFTLYNVACATNATAAATTRNSTGAGAGAGAGAGVCTVVPAVPVGAMVYSEDWPAPERGSTIHAEAGVYAFPPNATTPAALPFAHYGAAHFMSGGIALLGTVSSTGRPLSVIDGRSLSKGAVTVDSASDVSLRGFDIRRGQVYANQADGFSLTHSRVHHSTGGVSVAYSNNVTVAFNKIFDNTASAQAVGIAIHRGVDYALVANNTVTNCDCCVRVFAGSTADVRRPGVVIVGNVMTRCTDFAGLVAEPGVQLSAVRWNNIWLTGKGGGLKEMAQPKLGTQLDQYYDGVNQSAEFRTRAPDDLHEDPEIVSWDEASPDFLCSAAGSTSAAAGVGACVSAAPTLTGRGHAWQGVLNSDFSAGMWGWQGHTFPSNPDSTGLPVWRSESSAWGVTTSDGCAPARAPCAKIQTTAQPNGSTAHTRFRSAAFDVTRTRHGMNFTLGVSAKIQAGSAGRVSACITVVDFDDEPLVCQPLPMATSGWTRHELHLTVGSWLPATVSASFVVDGAPITALFDDVELRQEAADATQLPRGSACATVNLLLVDPPADALWEPGREVRLTARASASCSAAATAGQVVAVEHQLLTPNGDALASGSSHVALGANYSLNIPSNVSGGTLLNATVRDFDGTVVGKFTYRMLIAPPPLPLPVAGDGFSFCSTIEWHVQAALLNDGLLDRQLAANRALGINCHHVYLDSARMTQMLQQPFAEAVAASHAAAGITFLFTLLPNHIVDGDCGKPGAPCAAQSPFPVSEFCKMTVKTLVSPSVPSPRAGKTTPAQLERICELSRRLAQKMGHVVKYWSMDGEPQSNGLIPGEYAARVLPVLSTAVRDGAGPGAIIIGGGIVNGFRDAMWNSTILQHKHYDAFAFHPYRFNRLDPEASCLGLCGSTFRSQVRTANQDLARAGAAPRVYLTEEASGVTMQRTRAIGWSPFGGFDLSMRLSTFSQEELLDANFIARMWVTAIAEGAIGYNLHGGDENLLYLDGVGTPLLGSVAIHTISVTLALGTAEPSGSLFDDTPGPGPGPGNIVPLPTGPFRGYLFQSAAPSDGFVIALWMADAEFGTVGTVQLRLGGMSAAQWRGVTVINTFGNTLAVEQSSTGVSFDMGRDVVYLSFDVRAQVGPEQARSAAAAMLQRAVAQVGGSLGWQSPFW